MSLSFEFLAIIFAKIAENLRKSEKKVVSLHSK